METLKMYLKYIKYLKNDKNIYLIFLSMNHNDIISGVATGVISAVIFNPIDKAIYVSTTKNISIFKKEVWNKFYKGTMSTVMTRLITSGLYFSFLDNLSTQYSPLQTAVLTSVICNSLTNPIQLTKFHSWYNNISINDSLKNIYRTYGIRGFGIGFVSILSRDICFNFSYLSFKKKDEHLHNLSIITLSLIAVSPLNLIKNKKYASNESLNNIIKNFKFRQLGISYSVLRTSSCFYFSQYLYDFTKQIFSK
jgi:hypothetical protein